MSADENKDPDADQESADSSRYSRQIRFHELGARGQARLAQSTVLVVGCGALGSFIANILARSGVGKLILADRDFLEISNLQRQVLFNEADVAEGVPKAIAAARRLATINSEIEVVPIVKDIDHSNIESFCQGVDLIMDGTDNFEIRFLINDVSIKNQIPWVYGGCLGASGQTMSILPGQTACLHCLMKEGPPPQGSMPTCDTAGIIAPIIGLIASIECADAIKILTGATASLINQLTIVDLWDKHFRQLDLSALNEAAECPVCDHRRFEWLEGKAGSHTAILCGRNSVQLSFPDRPEIDLDALAGKLEGTGEVRMNEFMLKFLIGDLEMTLFPDGRAIVSGTEDIAKAKSLYSRFVGT